MHSRTCIIIALAALPSCSSPQHSACADAARLAILPPQLDETSGIAASRRHDGLIWAHNDSEGRTPTLYALDRDGRLLAEIALPGARTQFDWEAIATAPCADRDCIYIGDIGDNLHRRTDRAILRLPEPDTAAGAATDIQRFPIRFPHGPEDAEAMFVTRDGVIHVITKGRRLPVTLYRYPLPLRANERVTLEPIQQLGTAIAQLPDMVTGADISPDGRRIAIRTYTHVRIYRLDGDTLVPTIALPGIDITALGEPQGEAIAFAGPDTLLLATETGPAGGRPFVSRVTCIPE